MGRIYSDCIDGTGHNHQVLRGGRAVSGQDLDALPVRAPQVRRESAPHHRLRLLHQAQVQPRRQGSPPAALGHRRTGTLQLRLQNVPARRTRLRDSLLGSGHPDRPRDPEVEEDHRGEHGHGAVGQNPVPAGAEQVRPHQQREAREPPDQEVPRRVREGQRLLRVPAVLGQGQPQHRGSLPAAPGRDHPSRLRQEQPHQGRGQEGAAGREHRAQQRAGDHRQTRQGRMLLTCLIIY